MFIQLIVNFDNVAKVLFARFIHCKVATYSFVIFLKIYLFYLFIFGCVGSSLLRAGFL